MKRFVGLACVFLLGACGMTGPMQFSSMTEEEHLRCSALVMLYLEAVMDGRLERDLPEGTSLEVGAMSFVQAYGLSKGVGEKEAFAHVEEEKRRLSAELDFEEMQREAKACLEITRRS